MLHDPEQVPATPVYAVVVTDGSALIDGAPVDVPGPGLHAARVAVLTEIRVRAALRGRPVRVVAKDPTGEAWPLIVDPEGHVTTLDAPHPTPPSTPYAAPEPPLGAQSDPTPTAPPIRPAEDAWSAPFPRHCRDLLDQVEAAQKVGDLKAAAWSWHKVETALAEEYGPDHPYAVKALTARTWVVLRYTQETRGGEAGAALELVIAVVKLRRHVGAPAEDTRTLISNAHTLREWLNRADPAGAARLSEDVGRILDP